MTLYDENRIREYSRPQNDSRHWNNPDVRDLLETIDILRGEISKLRDLFGDAMPVLHPATLTRPEQIKAEMEKL